MRVTPLLIRLGVAVSLAMLLAGLPRSQLVAQESGAGQSAQADSGDDLLSGFDDPAPEGGGGAPAEGGGEQFNFDNFDSAFDEPPGAGEAEGGEEPEQPEPPSFWSLDGFARLASTYNYAHDAPDAGGTDYRGLSKLRAALQLELSLDLPSSWKAFVSGQYFNDLAYGINGRDNYTDEVLEQYGEEAEFKEVFIQGTPLDSLDFKFGRQIVVWGKSDNIQVTDVLNPIDNREPGLVDIEDMRLPVTMTRLDYYHGDWGLTGVAIHEIRFNKNPVPGSDFYPYPTRMPPEEVPGHGGANTEYGLALSGIFSGWDVAFYWASLFDDQTHFASLSGTADPVACYAQGDCELRHSRINMSGAAFNIALGNWLFKSEVARFDGLEFFYLPGEEKSRLDALVGFEFSGFTDITIALEAVDRRILDFDPVLENRPDGELEETNQYVLSYRADLLNQTLNLVAVAILFGGAGDEGTVQRYSATYDLFDAFAVTGGVVTYQGGSEGGTMAAVEKNDRLFLDAKYDF